jgi:hypothetical protein
MIQWAIVATLLWAKCGGESQHSQSWGLGVLRDSQSSGTPECLEFENKAQKTFHWGVPSVIEKVLKRRYRKWPRIGHLDICSPSYGQKKGRESNWQFDSRPLKVGNRPAPNVRWRSATRRWKDLDEGYNIGSNLVPIQGWGEEVWLFKVLRVQLGQLRESREKVMFGCHSRG